MTLGRFPRLALLHAALPVILGVASPAFAETLTAEAALATAARDNPSLRAALLDAQAARLGVDAERGARDAVLDATVSAGYGESFGISRGSLARQAAFLVTSNVSVSYTTDIGTALVVGTEWRRTTVGPQYDGSVYAEVTQPLLRGAGADAQLSGIRSAEASANAEELRRSATASQTALDVLRSYYELWYAERAVEVEQEALKTAERQVAEAKLRESALGTGSRVDVLQFATSAASFADALSQARATRSARAIELGRLLGITPERARGLEASGDLPVLAPPPASRVLIEGVSARSPELAAARAELASMSTRLDAARDQDQPLLDLFSRASAGGTWRDDELPGLELPGSQPAWSVEVGLHLQLPLGGGRAAAEATRASVELAAAQERYKAETERIRAQVTTLSENLDAANEQVALASETSKRATELVEAERQRLQLGTTTPSEVVKAEQTAREAELRRLRAVVSKLTSQYELEHASGGLLGRFPVSPAEKS
jgi:outer membrane protein TolC